jgi:hypothetical protein
MKYRCENGQLVPDPDGDWIRTEITIATGTAIRPPGLDGQRIVVWTLKSSGTH